MLITNAKIITWESPNRMIEDGAMLIDGDCIRDVGQSQDLVARYPDSEKFDAKGQFVLPGNICAHTHFYGAFARGMAIPGLPPQDFSQILSKLWWPLDKSLTHEDIKYSTLVCLIDAIKHGTTTLFDHHASPNAIDGSLDVIADSVVEAGVRAVLCYEVTDRSGPEKADAGIKENLRFIRKQEAQPSSWLAATFGLHASLTLSDQTLTKCREAIPDEFGFHLHAAEADADQYDSLTKYGMRVVQRLNKMGILGPKSILAHGVRIDETEINILANTKTWVTHQPRSNMNNGVGVAPIEAMLAADVKLGMGNDGFSNAMWEEWKTAYLLHKAWHRDPRRASGLDILRMAVYNNAILANQYFPKASIGVISPGASADVMMVNYHPFTPITAENIAWHILFGFQESMVTTTIVGGKLLMKDRTLLTIDEERVTAKARELSIKVWERYEGINS